MTFQGHHRALPPQADKYGEDGMLYIILIDTDQIIKFKELEEKYKNHSKVYVVDHMGIQRLLIN
jgi:hypothetical protein